MTGLHLVRLALDTVALTAFAVANGVSDDDYGYAAHLALRRRFGTAAPQPFRLFTEARGGPHLLGYTSDPAGLADAAGLPMPESLLEAVFPSAPSTRPMPEGWRKGARYGFEVRVRPVVRYGGRVRQLRAARDGAWQRRAGEVDAFVAACERDGDAALDREAVYMEWLRRQISAAATLDRAVPRLLRRLSTCRSAHGGQAYRRIEGYEALFAGELTVDEPARFARLLAGGVGRHAAFGFGLLVLAPPGRVAPAG